MHQHSLKLAVIALSCFCVHSNLVLQAQISDRPVAGPEQKKLEAWVGVWRYEGTLKDTPLGPGGKFSGKQTARLTLDGLFLESKSKDKGVYGGKEMTYESTGIRWYDPVTHAYQDRGFDNDGLVTESSSTVNGPTWSWTGSGVDSKGRPGKSRGATTFSADGKTATVKAEISLDDGKTWTPLYDLAMTRVRK